METTKMNALAKKLYLGTFALMILTGCNYMHSKGALFNFFSCSGSRK
jgi:hypothetical protein